MVQEDDEGVDHRQRDVGGLGSHGACVMDHITAKGAVVMGSAVLVMVKGRHGYREAEKEKQEIEKKSFGHLLRILLVALFAVKQT